MQTILSIDTALSETVHVTLDYAGGRIEKTSQSRVMKAQMVLPLIEEILKESGITSSDISEIRVAQGPGSFTGVRVGVAIANALGTLLDIPVNGKRALALPHY
ncbi:tRNA (adenosine(37)-N6)-threonylcarbamoyltransferase complex dimerization subunit type 1 TsaB [Candidatus Gottesmanbacteria bacterium RBG_13_45_10]|uniref:tRNA (Adenosine(37)-N6)-threonylcarbamoyltransferase complex dimerization subunit type 1 TsaB n=1 Tax=Candidatus Gottesmanbacteria bacterium RBG_13_45_10 TaxID=1798370 RepID=A0A1F5ZIK8_9BACT|nr:MAG: tRNA (adenosine(37)-N6)-threonylcarbamoyltransferase complex dimerization subunit type 1 TsaB [Candidatus Gottesmanbacteria bacterium RBG_13_45_10]